MKDNVRSDCPFNASLLCPPGPKHNCGRCGWNPVVSKERRGCDLVEESRRRYEEEKKKRYLARLEAEAGLEVKEAAGDA